MAGSLTRTAMRGVIASLIAISVTLLADVQPATAQTVAIRWRVENPFRFFRDPADTEVHRATYNSLGPSDLTTPVLAAEHALQRRHEDGWAATMYRKTCWNWTTNRYTCPDYDDYMNPKNHVVVADMAGIEDATNLTCTWLTAPKGGSVPRGDAIVQPCNETVEFEVPYPGAMKVSVEIGGRAVAVTDIKVRDILVAAMGDSFASGEGNPDIPVRFSRDRSANYGNAKSGDLSGFPARIGDWKQIGDKAFISENARWLDQACHRSLYSHQLRAALQLSVEDPHRAVTFVGVSCSGAEVTAGLFLRYKGNEWVPNPPVLSQISAVAEAQCGKRDAQPMDLPEAYHINGEIPELKGGLVLRKCPKDAARKIDLVLLSIGGNDIGFSRLVANAVLSSESTLRQLGGWIGELHGQSEATQQLSHLDARYKSLNRAIHSLLYVPWDESDRIILASYPGLALAGDGSETCKDGRAGMEVVADFQLSEQKLREGTWVADKLHRQMRESSEKYGWTFVETHRRAFIDRGICSGWADDGTNPADELRLPRKIDGVWKPYNPADYPAYASRKRWFRTPNDGFMTGNFHVAASVLQKVLKFDTLASFQLLLAATYSGSFHPTAEGHAAIADAVADKARAVLTKYGQGPEPDPYVATQIPLPPPAEEPGALGPEPAPPPAAPDTTIGQTSAPEMKTVPDAGASPAPSSTGALSEPGGASRDELPPAIETPGPPSANAAVNNEIAAPPVVPQDSEPPTSVGVSPDVEVRQPFRPPVGDGTDR
ncbi:MAG: hypothetical protein K2X41_04945 [Hyphomicrobium sp.]|nr:hypothetical protein [Hyphomicrobium sp.]